MGKTTGIASADPADWPEDIRIQEFPACLSPQPPVPSPQVSP